LNLLLQAGLLCPEAIHQIPSLGQFLGASPKRLFGGFDLVLLQTGRSAGLHGVGQVCQDAPKLLPAPPPVGHLLTKATDQVRVALRKVLLGKGVPWTSLVISGWLIRLANLLINHPPTRMNRWINWLR
jgi:hypothetical protein